MGNELLKVHLFPITSSISFKREEPMGNLSEKKADFSEFWTGSVT